MYVCMYFGSREDSQISHWFVLIMQRSFFSFSASKVKIRIDKYLVKKILYNFLAKTIMQYLSEGNLKGYLNSVQRGSEISFSVSMRAPLRQLTLEYISPTP